MHFAFPPRKTSRTPPYVAAANSRKSGALLPRRKAKQLALFALIALGFFYLVRSMFGSNANGSSSVELEEPIPAGTPPVVLVTTFVDGLSEQFKSGVKRNREAYAAKHGYATFYPNNSDYNLGSQPASWGKVPSMRHAMTVFPHSTFFFYLDYNTLILEPSINVETHITDKNRLEELMIVGLPVVPPDSVITTFSHLSGDSVNLILTQDAEGLCQNSFIVRRGEWAKYFLDAWFDPLYRSYNFQKAEGHALEHVVQWHGTVLSKLALIPQRIMNSYTQETHGKTDSLYQEGDFVVSWPSCIRDRKDKCEEDMTAWFGIAESRMEEAS
ncbi:glycosyltransferase family 34 protein [Aplosporella prunicola CBS 121167]|uniref:Glycosyltransferase family 34 protein n=1 Tax=Aplosporella prunicola CBS 121167 TaxID=1176127 RepID=A0A6A6BD83_9PEZI|nr:glycosyltransferase family 34 protein [Aplosporella prunicola CBS 121167]KAF2141255.1 glycosyltransferase family 34 protein [Aplosporella prunicola CBS 121167]